MSRHRGILLDLDGTLLNSNDAHAHAWKESILEVKSVSVPFEEIRILLGMGGDQLLPKLLGVSADTIEGKRLEDRKSEIFVTKYFPAVRPLPGAKDLVAELNRRGFRLTVATSAGRDDLKRFLDLLGIEEYIHAATSKGDVAHSKPSGDIIHAALASIDLSPDQVHMLGDTPYDIEAASKAGVRTIAFLSGGRSRADLAGAIAIYDGPADLLASLDESPLA